jgi:hypothetical protein
MGAFGPVGALTRVSLCGWLVLVVGCGSSSPGATPSGTGGTKADALGDSSGAGGSGGTIVGGGTGGAGVGTPVMQCQSLVKTVCTKFYGPCKPPTADAGATDEAACERQLTVSFGCERATTPYATCLSDTNLLSCASLFPTTGLSLPASCDAPLQDTPLSDPQSKCLDLVVATCTRFFECQGNPTPTQAQLSPCLMQVVQNADCGFVTGLGTTYNECLAGLKTETCPAPADAGVDAGDPVGIPACDTALIYVE